MKVGDLVWSLTFDNYNMGKVIKRRLAIIVFMDYDDISPYIIKLVACGRQGRTSKKYLEPTDQNQNGHFLSLIYFPPVLYYIKGERNET